jgi:hypothetical protein
MYEKYTIEQLRTISRNAFKEKVDHIVNKLYNDIMYAIYTGNESVKIDFDGESPFDFSEAELLAIKNIKTYFPGIRTKFEDEKPICIFQWNEEEDTDTITNPDTD